jgi:peptidoglycan/LPS O-acetylase OafA/YrhL
MWLCVAAWVVVSLFVVLWAWWRNVEVARLRGKEEDAASSQSTPGFCDALPFARFLAAVAIVFQHFCVHTPSLYSNSGVCLFFILAGFGATLSKLGKSDEWPPSITSQMAPVPRTLLRRVAAAYPTYFVADFATIAGATFIEGKPVHVPQVLVELTMLQSWVPWSWWCAWDSVNDAYNVPLWFISVLALFWLLEEATFTLTTMMWRQGGLVLCVAAWAALISTSPFTFGLRSWFYSPFDHWSKYFAGVALAFFVHERAHNNVTPNRWIASLVALIYLAVPCFQDPDALCADWFGVPADSCVDMYVKKAGLPVPILCLFVLGLVEGADPLAMMFSCSPLPLTQNITLPLYALQAPASLVLSAYLLGCPRFTYAQMLALFAFLLPAAFCVQRLVQEPGAEAINLLSKSLFDAKSLHSS